ncbi:MAG: MFS transporter, partial [Thermomicrobia bacterium]|nr:MFS transporter [Thermomicrobia bacterium]
MDPIIKDTGMTRSAISGVYAIGTFVSAAMVVLVSRMADRFSVRRVLPLVALALGLACFGMSLIAGPLSIFLAFAALRALGQGSMTINATLLAAQWFVRQRGR